MFIVKDGHNPVAKKQLSLEFLNSESQPIDNVCLRDQKTLKLTLWRQSSAVP
jgi:hypothetical protein